ncbi:hypothetical protein PTTG_27690 [Puccinia triticina 1-1 BBBD Race 1]|uniref:Uncharacterized protein n=2 Tax=Puccinia triticina TaxID=208348 RepID=A0A180GK27_PUCT1|nr:uncharacterized protein PtA15_14A481 [Puccinia triticina]OAV92313.1 hypothetical protein PTTG_27690 [Puccinia triticina 1-1 BBBD Race 1]WAQ91597.1 hypothetical protein PtA15_14A481 [Puccinia triticina]WAR62402.1 hypothetical protein PtB15_14B497 [Puccinia triticina]
MFSSTCPIGAPSRNPIIKRKKPASKPAPKCATPPPSSRAERQKGMIITTPPALPPSPSRSQHRKGLILAANELPPELKNLPPSPPTPASRRNGMVLTVKDLP